MNVACALSRDPFFAGVALSEALAMVRCAVHYIQSAEGCEFVEPSLFRYRGYRSPHNAQFPEMPRGMPLHRAKFIFIHYAIDIVHFEGGTPKTSFMANLYLHDLVRMCQILHSRETFFDALQRAQSSSSGMAYVLEIEHTVRPFYSTEIMRFIYACQLPFRHRGTAQSSWWSSRYAVFELWLHFVSV